ADVRLVGQDHEQPVDPPSPPARGRHAVLEGPQEILVEQLGLLVPSGTQPRLLLEAAPLLLRVVQLAERVRDLALLDEELPALDTRGVSPLELRERRERTG